MRSIIKKRRNERFVFLYQTLDALLCAKYSALSGGVNTYIEKLYTLPDIPQISREKERLLRYRNMRNRLAHDVGALYRYDGVCRADVRALKSLCAKAERGRDTVSKYNKRMFKKCRVQKAMALSLGLTGSMCVFLSVLLVILLVR